MPTLFEKLETSSRDLSLRFLVIGGHAINAYGYTRTTLDADILIAVEDAKRFRMVFEELGHQWEGETNAFVRFAPVGGDPVSQPIDLMLVDRSTFDQMDAQKVWLHFGEALLPVPSPLHLIALKLHAMRNPERFATGRDLADILQLIRICAIDLQSAEFQQTLDRYADPRTAFLLRQAAASDIS